MIIRLQHTGTLAFADSEGRWVADHASAFQFHTTHEVLLFCAKHRLSEVQCCYEFGDGKLSVTVPPDRSRPADRRA